MNSMDLYTALRLWAFIEEKKVKTKKDTKALVNIKRAVTENSGLDYRTILGLKRVFLNEQNITVEEAIKLTKPEFYTIENMVQLAYEGLTDIIPTTYFMNEQFCEMANITEIPDNFCMDNDALEHFTILPRIKKIGVNAFRNCSNLKSVTFYSSCNSENYSLKAIEDYAFAYCSSLKTIALPNGLKVLGEKVFFGCDDLKECIIPKTMEEIKDCPFCSCNKLTDVFYTGFGFNYRQIKGYENVMKGSSVLIDEKGHKELSRSIHYKTSVVDVLKNITILDTSERLNNNIEMTSAVLS